jgi:hypothetical protein
MDTADLEKLFDVKLDGLKSQVQNVNDKIDDVSKNVNARIDNLISTLKWLVGVVMPVTIVLLTAFINWMMQI